MHADVVGFQCVALDFVKIGLLSTASHFDIWIIIVDGRVNDLK